MNLLPVQYVERSRNKARSGRVAVAIIITLCAVAAFATHSRLSMNSSVEELVKTQARANNALEIEVDATSLERKKEKLESFVSRYKNEKTIFQMGDLVATITNMVPDSITLEEFSLDIVHSEFGDAISGRLSGFADSDERIARFVSALQTEEPFDAVSMDFSRSRNVREHRARGFRISFRIDLDKSWNVSRNVVAVGGEE
jgi:Tfp pilus assembly protein PilN|tara:strand:+ start:1403 stop:2002 length:600 start_codon:yes stop_codon:yes gene_type:complete